MRAEPQQHNPAYRRSQHHARHHQRRTIVQPRCQQPYACADDGLERAQYPICAGAFLLEISHKASLRVCADQALRAYRKHYAWHQSPHRRQPHRYDQQHHRQVRHKLHDNAPFQNTLRVRPRFQPPCRDAVKRSHREDVQRKHPSVLARRNMVQLLVNKRRFRQKCKHRGKAECLKKQIAHRRPRLQHSGEPACHQSENVHPDFARLLRTRQESKHQDEQNKRIRRQKTENKTPAAQFLQQRAEHRCNQRHDHQDNAD